MASRTYIQMWAKLNRMGKLPMSEEVRSKILQYADYINNHPEEEEQIVQARLKHIWLFKKLGYEYIYQYSLILLECVEIDKLYEHFMMRIQDTAVHKQDIGAYGKLAVHITEDSDKTWLDNLQLIDKDISYGEASKWFRAIEKGIFTMCDVALNNMRVTQYIGRPYKIFERGGQSIPTEIAQDYKAMANELADVIIKWHDIAEQKGYKIVNTSSQK